MNDEDNPIVISFLGIWDDDYFASSNKKRYHQVVWHSLSLYIFELEADSQSRCKVSNGVRVIELNDFEILEVAEDKTSEFGDCYMVKHCLSVGVIALKNQMAN